ncbi:MAG: permease-like cell division protein FtsX [Mogibacterium sp.]|nr:permease-like cell division protein FtsX [Mogibacterium sp.]
MYQIKQAFSQMGRNKGMYFTTILAITAMMLILGLFFVAFVNVDLFTATIKQDYNVIQVYISDDVDEIGWEAEKNALEGLNGVDQVVFKSKDEALDTLRERWGKNAYLLENLKRNPLPNSFMVYVEDKDAAAEVAKSAGDIDGISDVVYYQDTIQKLARVTGFVEMGSLIAMAFLIVVSIIIVANTLKLTGVNKEKEIGIMKYLGATDWFVRAPFVWGGIIIGLISAGISTGLIYLIYNKIIDIIGADIARILSMTVVPADYLVINLLIIFIALGVGIGACGSIISIRRFLDK